MGQRQSRVTKTVIEPTQFGVSFSVKQCRDFKLDPQKALQYLLTTVGFRRFRLMSYWDEHESKAGDYDFSQLDKQIELIEKHAGVITLCLGVRQPRWPESHWPAWALKLPQAERYAALLKFVEIVVRRYQSKSVVISWQLENEALNRSFGLNGDFNRHRLRQEFALVRKLDPDRSIIMSTSNTWGLPLRQPRPDQFGFTFYRVQYEGGSYRRSKLPPRWYTLRARLISLITGRSCFIHELQAEPWGPKAIWEMPVEEQFKSMDLKQLQENIHLAKQTKLYPMDCWGGEWWYWLKLNGHDITELLKDALRVHP